jgi:prolipoprotein diacylglyceryl transferase
MTTTVIAYFPSPPRGVWHIWLVPIRAYALFIIVGIVAALLIGDRRWVARGGERGVIYDIALWAVPFGLIGGRLYHLATDWRTYFGEGGAGPGAALRIWDGGLGIWGAVALGGVGAWIACRRRGIPLPAFGDAIAPGIVLAQAIGRLGNYFNQELFGRETTMPWGLEIFYRRDPAGFVDVHSLDGASTGQLAMVVQPTFLYELLWNLVVFAALIYLDRRFTIGHGRLFALYVAGYCIGRFCIELLRDDAATHIAGIRINSFTSTFVFIGAVVYLILAPKGREDPATLSGSAADRLLPDSVEEPVKVSSLSAASAAAVVDKPVGRRATIGTTVVDTRAVDKPDIAAEAVAAETATTEVAAPEVEIAETPEPAAAEEPAEEPVAEAEPEAEPDEAEEESADEPAAEVESEAEPAAVEEPAEEPVAEAEPEAEPDEADEEPAEAEPDEAEVEPADEPAAEVEPEAEPDEAEEEPAQEPAAEAEPEAQPDKAVVELADESAAEVESEAEPDEAEEEPAEEPVAEAEPEAQPDEAVVEPADESAAEAEAEAQPDEAEEEPAEEPVAGVEPEAQPDKAQEEPAEEPATGVEPEAEPDEAQATKEAAQPADDNAAATEQPARDRTPEPPDWPEVGLLLRLSSWLRRR